jgi:hypothetical protein
VWLRFAFCHLLFLLLLLLRVCAACQVCPANWKPGDKTIIADPERSLDYFEKAHKVRIQHSSSLVPATFVPATAAV